jgi:hypothetical protein
MSRSALDKIVLLEIARRADIFAGPGRFKRIDALTARVGCVAVESG